MGTTQSATTTTREEPTNEQLRRLAIEAGKFLGKSAGDSLSLSELRSQGEANGFADSELRRLLESDGLVTASKIRIPDQGDSFGELWDVGSDDVGVTPENDSFENRSATRGDGCGPEPLDDSAEDCYLLHEPIADSPDLVGDDRYLDDGGEPLTAFDAVGSYIERRHGENVSADRHGYHKTRHWRRKRQYALGKEMDRQLLDAYENPTTTLLSLRLSPGDRSRLTLLQGLHDAIEATIDQLRYRLQEAPDAPLASGDWEYIAVIAGTRGRATPHLHIYVWIDGDVSREVFAPVVEKFVAKCPYAPDDMRGNSPDSDDDGKAQAVSIRGNGDNTIPRLDDAPTESQGSTYVLPQLPHLPAVDSMARDELLHSSTIDASNVRAFRKSQYTVWNEEEPSPENISGVAPTSSDDAGDSMNHDPASTEDHSPEEPTVVEAGRFTFRDYSNTDDVGATPESHTSPSDDSEEVVDPEANVTRL